MPELVKIRSELFPKLYEAFLHDDDPLSDEQDWRNVFDYQWEQDEDHAGYALLEDEHVIGMMAMAFSQRLIDGHRHKFCNLHTWWVHEDHRGRSVAMLRPLLNLDGYTVTHFTPCDRIRALTRRLGFVELDLQMKALLPLGRTGKQQTGGNSIRLYFDQEIDVSRLAEPDQRILQDHLPYRAGHLFADDGRESCYILYTHVVRYRINYCHIQYVSNREFFLRNEPLIRKALLKRHRVWIVVVNSRQFRDQKFRRSFDFWAPAHAVFKPTGDICQDQIDSLYSDVVMLRLAVLPHLSYELKQLAVRSNPFRRNKQGA